MPGLAYAGPCRSTPVGFAGAGDMLAKQRQQKAAAFGLSPPQEGQMERSSVCIALSENLRSSENPSVEDAGP